MSRLVKAFHLKFMERAFASSQFLPNVYSTIPSLIFFITFFVFLYQHIHRHTTVSTKWKTRIIRDLKFHWIYFNATRVWYIFICCFKRLISVADEYIDINLAETDKHFHRMVTYGAALAMVSTLAVIPALMIYVNYLWKYDMPNFLMWVMEDPYLRHEIGLAGHCLERPIRMSPKDLANYPNRFRRSVSFDNKLCMVQKSPICRLCKSMIVQNVVKSMEELVD